LETFVAAARRKVERLATLASETARGTLDPAEFGRQVERSFAPYLERLTRVEPAPQDRVDGGRPGREGTIEVVGDDPERATVETALKLGDRLALEGSRARRLAREAEALREVSELLAATGASFDRERIVEAALEAARRVLEFSRISLVSEGPEGTVLEERRLGPEAHPLLRTPDGRLAARELLRAGRLRVVADPAPGVVVPVGSGRAGRSWPMAGRSRRGSPSRTSSSWTRSAGTSPSRWKKPSCTRSWTHTAVAWS
jgi:hypothetical protein